MAVGVPALPDHEIEDTSRTSRFEPLDNFANDMIQLGGSDETKGSDQNRAGRHAKPLPDAAAFGAAVGLPNDVVDFSRVERTECARADDVQRILGMSKEIVPRIDQFAIERQEFRLAEFQRVPSGLEHLFK
jgi:hypothetical protein